jgi:rhamnose utilization protein RhaD (predicted bifunctional aldolase and dehydrogenase)
MLADLIRFSASIGQDLNLVQAGGGNTSLKDNGVLWVKASGKWLARADQEDMFVPAPLENVLRSIDDGREYVSESRTALGTLLRPSVETTMHAVLPHRVVVHVHSVNTIAWAVEENAADALRPRLEGLRWVWLPYVHPGVRLARAIRDLLGAAPDVLVLGNHGLVIGAGDCDSASALLADVERRLERRKRRAPPARVDELHKLAPAGFRLPPDDEVHAIATDSYSASVVGQGLLYPDQCVYLGAPAIIRDDTPAKKAVDQFAAAYSMIPKYLVAPGKGILISEELNRAGWELLIALERVLQRLDPDRGVHFLDAAEVSRLMNWDAERYRIAVGGRYLLEELPHRGKASRD